VESSASSTIFKVYVVKNAASSVQNLNPHSVGTLRMRVFPNPNNGVFGIKFNLENAGPVQLTILDMTGKTIVQERLSGLFVGENIITRRLDDVAAGQTYLVTLETGAEKATVKTVVQE